MQKRNELKEELSPALRKAMADQQIDIELSLALLKRINEDGLAAALQEHFEIPQPADKRIINCCSLKGIYVERKRLREVLGLKGIEVPAPLKEILKEIEPQIYLSRALLEELGFALLPYTAYGVLNGGSASSYIDPKKNKDFCPELFEFYQKDFEHLIEYFAQKPKGLTPAFINPDGSPGPTFLELKLRALLIQCLSYQLKTNKPLRIPFFQMTSVLNNELISKGYQDFSQSPLLADLFKETGFNTEDILTGVQPLVATFTSASHGLPRRIFDSAYGKPNTPLAMPGGHGQNFKVLAPIYQKLYQGGRLLASLGNVDNLGYTLNPLALALTFLRECDASFEFSYRTPIDIKGGVLVVNQTGRLDCRDLGAGISFEQISQAENKGFKVLFNCAIGLFNLSALVPRLSTLPDELPLRLSEQNKKPGRYAQVEQITWEVISLLDQPLILGVEKYDRFLAVKVISEGLLTSGFKLADPAFPTSSATIPDIKDMAAKLNTGLSTKLRSVYGMELQKGRWVPLSLKDLKARLLG